VGHPKRFRVRVRVRVYGMADAINPKFGGSPSLSRTLVQAELWSERAINLKDIKTSAQLSTYGLHELV
jgi:hypothetical protein